MLFRPRSASHFSITIPILRTVPYLSLSRPHLIYAITSTTSCFAYPPSLLDLRSGCSAQFDFEQVSCSTGLLFCQSLMDSQGRTELWENHPGDLIDSMCDRSKSENMNHDIENNKRELTRAEFSLFVMLSQTILNSRPSTKLGNAMSKRPNNSRGSVISRPRKEAGVISPYPTVVIANIHQHKLRTIR